LTNDTEEPDDFVVPELFFTEFSAVLVRKLKHDKEFVKGAVLMNGVWLTADKEAARRLNSDLVIKLADFS
jgi:hypothetical protein